MPAILPSVKIDADSTLAEYFTPYQVAWIEAEDPLHARHQPVFALAEKSVRIGWTYADAFKNVRKRLRFKNRDYLFATKDWPSALEYMNLVYQFAELLDFTRAIVSHGEDYLKPGQFATPRQPAITEEIKIGCIKFDNGSRIIAFSASPQAMAVYGGDVGLDEFAKHSHPELLWQTAQARVTWGFDLALWSSHDGEDTLFNQFANQARAGKGPWNLYFRVTMPDALDLGLLQVINRVQSSSFESASFLAACRSRAGSDEIYQQSYLCNPLGAASAALVEWSAIERCRFDYPIERVHLEADEVPALCGYFDPATADDRTEAIHRFLLAKFPALLGLAHAPRPDPADAAPAPPGLPDLAAKYPNFRLGFDVAASGQGDLAVIYIDQAQRPHLWLRALFSCRTDDWHFLKTVLFFFLKNLRSLCAAGDESGLGRQICWEAARQFPSRFHKVNFAAKKHDLGFTLMNQLAVTEKRFPRSHTDVAADYFALRKTFAGSRWIFTEGRNSFNPASHCDLAWAGALASYAHTRLAPIVAAGARVG